ncbi:Gp138 family membrane-puncturing spike protein [Klebsiella pneumoniae]|uniref:Gp138 family membrane-puncturing spike protein n=1 Tax=Klebsiella pneumoniae TaxID=573 RepID=UPI000E2C265A|nr:Gp138 family membrane-puncturing spike protein [Klebsiella pneumoniae]SXK95417.1 putative bacteriophage protein [Klebsiella pneumoniae]
MANIRPAELQETLERVKDKSVANARTALPGVILSFDPDTVTCSVSLCSKSSKPVPYEDISKTESMDFPLLVDLPVVFPRGGGVTLTFPLAEGDECLVVFSDRCIDFWWQNGGVQELVDWRSHDLSDAFVIPGPQSQAKKISGISTSAVELRSDDGSVKLSLNPASGAISGTAPGGFNLNGLKILPDGRLQLVDGSIVDKHTHGGVESGGSSTAPLGG